MSPVSFWWVKKTSESEISFIQQTTRFLINLHIQKVVFLLTMRKMYLRRRCRQADSVYAINFNYIYPCEHLRQTNIDLVEWLMDIFFSPFFSLCVLSRCCVCVCILFTYIHHIVPLVITCSYFPPFPLYLNTDQNQCWPLFI